MFIPTQVPPIGYSCDSISGTNSFLSASASASSSRASYGPEKAVDGITTAAAAPWEATTTTGWLQVDLGAGNEIVLGRYKVWSDGSALSRMANTWTMLGSNNGVDWDTLDSQSGQSWATTFTAKTYDIADVSGTAHRYFRMNITANNGDGSYLQVHELQGFACI